MTAIEWDVFALQPGGDYSAPEYLATLYDAREKSIRVELDGTGSGSFAINHTSPECTEAILAQGNLVKVRIPEIHSDYIFAFFLETGDFTLVSSDEVGGEMLHFGGRGILSYLEYAVAWSESYIAGGQSPTDGVWRAYLAGTGHAPGQILMRMIEEMQDPDRPQQPIPLLLPDFDYSLDSDGNAWTDPDATDEFSYQIGENGLAIVIRLIPTGVSVQMDPDFTLHAYNELGRDLTGDAFGTGVVRFEKGVNIATELRREQPPNLVATHELVAGETDHYGRAVLADASSRVTKETYLASFGTTAAALNAVGLADLQQRLRQSETITFPIANRRTSAVVLSDPVSIGSALGPLAINGFYLPGPPNSDNGDFWVGDIVRVHTGTGPFDYNEIDARVMAITIARDDENRELIVTPELRTVPPTVEVFLQLQRPQSLIISPGQNAQVGWAIRGDDIVPPPARPTIGPLSATPGSIPNNSGVNDPWAGVTFGGAGTITIASSYRSFTACTLQPLRVDILINGSVALTGSWSSSAGEGRVDGTISVNNGDVLTAYFHHDGEACAIYLDGTGGLDGEAYNLFTITGSLAVA